MGHFRFPSSRGALLRFFPLFFFPLFLGSLSSSWFFHFTSFPRMPHFSPLDPGARRRSQCLQSGAYLKFHRPGGSWHSGRVLSRLFFLVLAVVLCLSLPGHLQGPGLPPLPGLQGTLTALITASRPPFTGKTRKRVSNALPTVSFLIVPALAFRSSVKISPNFFLPPHMSQLSSGLSFHQTGALQPLLQQMTAVFTRTLLQTTQRQKPQGSLRSSGPQSHHTYLQAFSDIVLNHGANEKSSSFRRRGLIQLSLFNL